MPNEFGVRVEAQRHAATIYLSGPLTTAGVWQTLRRWEQLPPHVRVLRLDLNAATLADPGPIAALAMLLHRWRRRDAERHTHIQLPPVDRRPRPVPLSTPRARTDAGSRGSRWRGRLAHGAP